MDANTRNETRDRQREEALARRLGEAFDKVEPRGTQTDPCPDAELIAAFHERSMGPDETAACEAHFAGCSRCRKILSVLAASDDTPLAQTEVSRLGELIASAKPTREPAPRTFKPVRPSVWDWRARWLAPAFGVAAVLAVWFAVRPPWHGAQESSSGTLVAHAPTNEIAPNAQPPTSQFDNTAPEKKASPESAARSKSLSEASASRDEIHTPAQNSDAKQRLDQSTAAGALAADAGAIGKVSKDQKKEKTDSATSGAATSLSQTQIPAAPPAPTPTLQAEAQATEQNVPQEARPAASAPVRAIAEPAARAPVANKSVADQSMATFGARAASGANIAGLLKSPSGAVTWRIGAGGRIERSTDAGRSWILQASPAQDEWLAGSAVSERVAWIVGRNGKIARTTDAEHWETIDPPPMSSDASGKFPDWIAVIATDAQSATITASDQRRFATQDAGKTWQPL